MRLLVIVLVAFILAGVGVANVVLLGYGGERNDPVGKLSPVLRVSPAAPTQVTTTVDRHGGRGGPDD